MKSEAEWKQREKSPLFIRSTRSRIYFSRKKKTTTKPENVQNIFHMIHGIVDKESEKLKRCAVAPDTR